MFGFRACESQAKHVLEAASRQKAPGALGFGAAEALRSGRQRVCVTVSPPAYELAPDDLLGL